jgi:antitoxin PrlF
MRTMASAKLTSKGQITVPKRIRAALHLGPEDRIDFTAGASGEVVVRAKTRSISELYGALKRPSRRALTLSEMDGAVLAEHRKPPR